MRIGLLLPSILMSKKYQDRIFAARETFVELCDGLMEKGHDVFAYASENTKTKAKLISGKKELEEGRLYSVKDIPSDLKDRLSDIRASLEYELDLTKKAITHAQENNLDVLHFFHSSFTSYFAPFTKIPTILTLNDPIFPKDTLEYSRLTDSAGLNYVTISDSQKNNYQKEFSFSSIKTIYLGLKERDFTFSQDSQDYLAFLGRYIPEKGVVDAIKASFALNMPIKMASSNNYKETAYYEKEIKPYLSSQLIEEMAYLSSVSEKSKFLSHAKALLFPIQWEEPFGMVMIESMACGTPVIAYNRGSVSEIVRDGVTGFIIDPDDEDRPGKGSFVIKKKGLDGLMEAIKKISEIDRKNCRKHVEEKFSIEKMIENYEKLYQEIIK